MKSKNKFRKITRRGFLKESAALGAVAAGLAGCEKGSGGGTADGSGRPNIVYILMEQQRGDAVGAMGHPVVKTPNQDRIARDGVVFGRCYSNGPLCRPSRAAIITGRYPHQNRVWNNYQVPSPGGVSHVRRMRDEAGYCTAVLGKTHLHRGSGHLDDHQDILRKFGFESIRELIGVGQETVILPVIQDAYTDWLTASTPPGETDKYERLIDYAVACVPNGPEQWLNPASDGEPWLLSTSDNENRFLGRVAADWIREYDDERPFYLQVNFPGPHGLFDATTEYLDMYDYRDPDLPPGILVEIGENSSRLIGMSRDFQNISGITEEEQRRLQTRYYADISMVDGGVGDVLAALEETGMLDNTWIVLSSDHGEQLGDHCLVQKSVFYEQSVHVPLIVRPPGGTLPWRSEALVDQLDVTASILALAGLDNTEGHGHSLVAKVEGGASLPDADVGDEWVLSEIYQMGMLRTDDYKLIIDYQTGASVELYDLINDPNEIVNVVDDPAYAEVVAELFGIVDRVIREDGGQGIVPEAPEPAEEA